MRHVKTLLGFLSAIMGLALLALIIWDLHSSTPISDQDKPVHTGEIIAAEKIGENRESCITCHATMKGFSTSHDPRAIGCSSCHLGNPLSMDKIQAHAGMELYPGNLQTVHLTCGTRDCHPDLTSKVSGSLMASGRGMVSVNRYVFGVKPDPDGTGHLSRLGHTPADWHLHQLCRVCHLGTPRETHGPITEESIGGGCIACHLHYTDKAHAGLKEYKKTGTFPAMHPQLTIKPDDTRCFACHSRSSRISLSYKGLHETTLDPHEASPDHVVHEDGRVFKKMPADVHHERGLSCVDCHTARDTMGDGKVYRHQNEQVEVACTDCHRTAPPKTVTADKLDDDTKKMLKLRHDNTIPRLKYLVSDKTGRPFSNVFLDSRGKPVLQSKSTGKLHEMKKPLAVCTSSIRGHESLTCKSCHTSWSPTCIACHTGHDKQASRLAMLLKGKDSTPWRELTGEFVAVPPTLGIRENRKSGHREVDTFIPGMILTIDNVSFTRNKKPGKSIGGQSYQVFKRLYAPASSHTIVTKARSCQSCHLDSRAVGYGRGRLKYNKSESFPWTFKPYYGPHPVDGMPLDAWINPGSKTLRKNFATRSDIRPFNYQEQYNILRVGRCLTCHPSNGKNPEPIYLNFAESLKNRKPVCGTD